MKNKKLTSEEIEKLQEIQQKNAAVATELGNLEITKLQLEARKGDVIKFYNNINDMSLPIAEDKFNEFNYQTCTHQCVPGKLMIFKSDFLHGCPTLKGNEKIVVSFNIKTY